MTLLLMIVLTVFVCWQVYKLYVVGDNPEPTCLSKWDIEYLDLSDWERRFRKELRNDAAVLRTRVSSGMSDSPLDDPSPE